MEILKNINIPQDLKHLDLNELIGLSQELKDFVMEKTSVKKGHIESSLTVTELTVALHYLLDTPRDALFWDVGHQAYGHKILTGRRSVFHTNRKYKGISGFPKIKESEYDNFGVGHSSTSISAALGMAVASRTKGELDRQHVAVIGDGAISAGMAYEAMNNAGATDSKQIVILNDNDMSIAPPVGAMSHMLAKMVSSGGYQKLRGAGKAIVKDAPRPIKSTARKAEEYTRGMFMGGTWFEELGFYYVGPVDGHDLDTLIPVLENVKKMKNLLFTVLFVWTLGTQAQNNKKPNGSRLSNL